MPTYWDELEAVASLLESLGNARTAAALRDMADRMKAEYNRAALDLRDARAALRLAVEAMERMLAYPEVEKFVGGLTFRPMSAALAACRKAVKL